MNDEENSTDLTESERGEESSSNAVLDLHRSRWVDEELERSKLGRDVVRVSISGNQARLNRLNETVEHPSSSSTCATIHQQRITRRRDRTNPWDDQ